MSGTDTGKIAWDSCIFLAWFNQEDDKPLDEIAALLRMVESGKLVLYVSAICAAEVLDLAGESDAGTKFSAFLKRDYVVPVNVDFRIAQRAAQFRQRIKSALDRGEVSRGLRAPDAIIAASAVIYRVPVLHTFDPDLLVLRCLGFFGQWILLI
jgi:predicted nucleic acid-binding protein